MAFVDNNSQDTQSQVAGASPLSTGTNSVPMNTEQAPTGSTGSTIQSQAPEGSNVPQSGTTNKKAPKASSGMFTNIQKYVDKNKPQAQQMAGAVTQDIGKQAEQIRQAAAEKQALQQQTLKANQNLIDQNTQWANQQVQGILNPTNTVPTENDTPITVTPQDTDIDRFQQLLRGKIDGIQQVGDLNLTQQQSRAQALSQLAGSANTEEGRRNLLGETFKKQANYNRGMSGLDQLITSGDAQAREALIQGTLGQSEALQQGLGDIQSTSRSETSENQRILQNLGQNINDIALNPLEGIQGNIDSTYEQTLAERAALLNPESEEYKQALAAAENQIGQLQNTFGSRGAYADYLESVLPTLKSDGRVTIQQYIDATREFDRTGGIQLPGRTTKDSWGRITTVPGKVLKGKEAEEYLSSGGGARMSHHKHRVGTRDTLRDLDKILSQNSDLYGTKGIDTGFSSNYNMSQMLGGSYDKASEQLKNIGTAEEAVQRRLAQEAGINYDQLLAGDDIGRYDTASQDQINKMNALNKLLGKNEIVEEQLGDRKYTSAEALRNLLAKYGA